MSRNKEYLKWLVENSDLLNLNVEVRTDIYDILPCLTNVKTTISFDGEQYDGFGIADNEDLALIKSSVEAFERLIGSYQSQFQNSNGIAAHFTVEDATKNAKLELIERDDFLTCYLLRVRPTLISHHELKNHSKLYSPIYDYCQQHNFYLELFLLNSTFDASTTMCSVRLPNHGMIMSLGSGESIKAAVESSLLQNIRKVVSVTDRKLNSITVEEFKCLKNHGPDAHMRLSLSDNYYHQFYSHMSGGSSSLKSLAFEDIETIEILPKNKELIELIRQTGIHVIKARSDFAQELYFGNLTECKINKDRFRSQGIDYNMVSQYLPHPMA